jgi:acyl transferase domain-containing protein
MTSSSDYSTALAIVGMAGRFPGASSLEHFWQNIAGQVCSIRQYSEEELLDAGVKPEDLARPNYVKAGAHLQDIESFDTAFFGLSPREAEILDPQFRVFLECAWEVLEMAGYDLTTTDALIGVFAGAGYKNYMLHHLTPTPAVSETFSEFQLSLGQEADVLATLVAYKLNLKGPCVAVQSFCSTSLAAVHLACQSLLNYECDLAIAGASALNSLQKKGYFYEEGRFVSPDGSCRTFDIRAQGSVLSNGVAVVALKRLQEAIADGDTIHAVIRGSAMNNDGNQHVSYTAPGLDGQATVIASALSYAGVHPETISYIEANGSSTRMGDAIELAAMRKAFAGKTQKKGFCAVSSLKPNIGHLDRASGVAGLIKTVLAMEHGQLPPHLHYEQPDPEVDLRSSPFYITTRLTPWPRQQTPRRAGVNSFGLGGTNVHLVIEEAPARAASSPSRPWQLLPLSARSAWSLQAAATNLAAHLRAHPEQPLPDVAYTLQVGRGAFSHRQFVLAQSGEQAAAALENLQGPACYQEHRDRPLAFLFTDAEQILTLAGALWRQEPGFREQMLACYQAVQQRLGPELVPTSACADATAEMEAGQVLAGLIQAGHRELATFLAAYALARLLLSWHISPRALFGLGPGAYVAACLAGIFTLPDALAIVHCHERERAALPALLRSIPLHTPAQAVLSSCSGAWLTAEEATNADYWVQAADSSACLPQGVELLTRQADSVLLEIGGQPRPGGESHVALSLAGQEDGQAALLTAIGHLWLAGVTIGWRHLSAGEQRLRVTLPTYAFERQHCWIDDPANRQAARQLVAQAPRVENRAAWFYLPYWEPTLPAVAPADSVEQTCLIFADSSGLGELLAQNLAQHGGRPILVSEGEAFVQQSEDAFCLRPAVSADYQALFAHLTASGRLPALIVHCASISTPGEQAALSLLHLVRTCQMPAEARARLIVICRRARAVVEYEPIEPGNALLPEICRVIADEYPGLSCRCVDIPDLPQPAWARARMAADLAAECLAEAPEAQDIAGTADPILLAHRNHTRWLRRYAPMLLETPGRGGSLRAAGVFVITPGLSEQGLLLAEFLAGRSQARLVLLTPTVFPACEQWPAWLATHPQDEQLSGQIRRLQALGALGAQVLVMQVELEDPARMHQAIEETLRHFGVLHAVIHLAQSTDPQAIVDLDQSSGLAHLQAEMQRLSALHKAIAGLTLDFCLLVSPLSCVLGGVGCLVDAAIGAHLNAFAERENRTSACPWISVNADPWQTGAQEPWLAGTRLARYLPTAEEGTDALERALASGWPQMAISTGNLALRMRQARTSASQPEAARDRARPETAGVYTPAGSPTEHRIVEVWRQLLGYEQIGIHDNFFALHGHSLLGMQLIARLRQIFQVDLPLTRLFSGPTVAELALAIEELLIAEIAQMAESDVQVLMR